MHAAFSDLMLPCILIQPCVFPSLPASAVFAAQEIDLQTFMFISDADLVALNIPVAYHARLLAAIEQFKRMIASGTTDLQSLLMSFILSFPDPASARASASASMHRAPPPPFARRKPCKFFVESHCRFGTGCAFSHDQNARNKFHASLANK